MSCRFVIFFPTGRGFGTVSLQSAAVQRFYRNRFFFSTQCIGIIGTTHETKKFTHWQIQVHGCQLNKIEHRLDSY